MKRMEKVLVVGLSIMWCSVVFSVTAGMAEEVQLPPLPPSIEELTGGTVKIGDLITKDNVDLVKGYLPLGLYQCVTRGMVLKMAGNLPPEKLNPASFLKATERNRDKAVIDDHGVVTLRDGSPWPGGIPFSEPKSGLEVMGYVRFGNAYNDWETLQPFYFVNKEGRLYKTGVNRVFKIMTHARHKVSPLGSVPGMEDTFYRFITVFVHPLELKGLGQFNINYVDDVTHYDAGFAYLPAFKRTIRISAITFQDNIGGSDLTFGDPEGLREPFGTWNYKLIEKKLMLVTEPVREFQPTIDPGGIMVDPKVDWDEGMKYVRLGWTVNPVYVVEATPKDPGHIYSKKILHVHAPFFSSSLFQEVTSADIYDRSGELWKFYFDWRGGYYLHKDGEQYTVATGFTMHDLQSGHQTHGPNVVTSIDAGSAPETLTLRKLLQLGR